MKSTFLSPDFVCSASLLVCRSKCSCHQLTLQATGCTPGAQINPNAGYHHKRLEECLPTGSVLHNQPSIVSFSCWVQLGVFYLLLIGRSHFSPSLTLFTFSESMNVISGVAVMRRCVLTVWFSMGCRSDCSSLRPRIRAGAFVALMTLPRAPLFVSMQVTH